jgi:hypothetical protein
VGILPAEESGGIVEIGAKKAQAVDELEIVAAFLFPAPHSRGESSNLIRVRKV